MYALLVKLGRNRPRRKFAKSNKTVYLATKRMNNCIDNQSLPPTLYGNLNSEIFGDTLGARTIKVMGTYHSFLLGHRCPLCTKLENPLTSSTLRVGSLPCPQLLKWCLHYGVNCTKLGPFQNVQNIFLCFKRHQLRAIIGIV